MVPENNSSYTLAEVVELFCLHQFNDRKKYFDSYLPMAKLVWEDIFLRTIWASTSKWMPLKSDGVNQYIDVPPNMNAFLALFTTDKHNRLQSLTRNNRISVIPKPVNKSCGCTSDCSCGSLCSSMAALSYTETDVVIDGTTYMDKTWFQVCAGGEIKKWREVPTKKYQPDGITYSIVSEKISTSVCTIDVLPCGCVAETDLNKQALEEHCCCVGTSSVGHIHNPRHEHPQEQYDFSACGKKIIILNARSTYYLLHHQNKNASANSRVPWYCLDVLFSGINNRSTRWNPTKTWKEKELSKDDYELAKKDVFKFLNPINLSAIDRISGERKSW